jgi:hypothetical protein
VIAGEPLPKGPLVAKSKCEGTVEDHRNIALDVRELIRKHVFEQPVGSTFHLSIAYPWLRVMRLKQFPAYLNRWDSQQARNEGVFAH